MTANHLKTTIPIVMSAWSDEKRNPLQERSLCPLPIVALVEFIQIQSPRIYDGGKKLGGGDQHVNWYHHHFPRGVVCFQIPYAGRPEGALLDPLYESIEGATIYFTRWELNAPDIPLHCPNCAEGILRHVRINVSRSVHSLRRGNYLENWHDKTSSRQNSSSSMFPYYYMFAYYYILIKA